LIGATFGIAFAAFITDRFEDLQLDPLRLFVLTAAGTLFLVPAGLGLWVVGATIERGRMPTRR
jgi:hypothetical protein